MRFKTDENLPVELAEMLRSAGHDTLSVLEQRLGGEPDIGIARICQAEARAMVTLDMDFGDLRRYPPELYAGIIVLRVKRQDTPYLLEVFARAMRLLGSEPLEGCLWVVDEERVRIRPGK